MATATATAPFHVACPITSERICFCKLGFPSQLQTIKGTNSFINDVLKIEDFFQDLNNTSIRVSNLKVDDDDGTVEVKVPKLVVPPPVPVVVGGPVMPVVVGPVVVQKMPKVMVQKLVLSGMGVNNEGVSGMGKRKMEVVDAVPVMNREVLVSTVLPRVGEVKEKGDEMSKKKRKYEIELEEFSRKNEAERNGVEALYNFDGEDQANFKGKVMCRMCLHGEHEGSEKADRMLGCKNCNKKYHKKCLKSWSQNRDLFDPSSWTCPSCRSCEICQRTGDPTKFLFCKRCDGAYHCYCQHPPHKNASSGPYLCTKHTKCHSCESTVPGNGLSTRWFLGYTYCDACGRLFVKGNYCPVCLKVYRDSESIPMVCCDVCERWVHCNCDGISDDKYQQFQVDGNLYYKCAACRGECYKVKDPDDAAKEVWRRRDKSDHAQIANMRIAAGLPAEQQEISVSDDDYAPGMGKHDSGRSMKFSLKGSVHKTPKKEYGNKYSIKKYGKRKGYQVSSVGKSETIPSFEYSMGEDKNDDIPTYRSDGQEAFSSPVQGEKCSINQAGIVKHNFYDEVATNRESRPTRFQIKPGKGVGGLEPLKGTKLVINLGGKNRNLADASKSETSGGGREDFQVSNETNEGLSQRRSAYKTHGFERRDTVTKDFKGEGEKHSHVHHSKGPKHKIHGNSFLKIGKVKSKGENVKVVETVAEPSTLQEDETFLKKHSRGKNSVLDSTSKKDHKPLLKLKFKNPYSDGKSVLPQIKEDTSFSKGQRSKRKRPSPPLENDQVMDDDDDALEPHENTAKDVMEANWILKKLGRDAIGKLVEVNQLSDNSWHKGEVTDVVEGTSILAIELDDGRAKDVDLEKQGVRFVSQKQKRSKTVRLSP